ncbi:MAG: hypothetical protein KDD64_13325 [Bdellovibrionales bacterium]|nr:hypothetical protein [Bdellovibrionales bacterium]
MTVWSDFAGAIQEMRLSEYELEFFLREIVITPPSRQDLLGVTLSEEQLTQPLSQIGFRRGQGTNTCSRNVGQVSSC